MVRDSLWRNSEIIAEMRGQVFILDKFSIRSIFLLTLFPNGEQALKCDNYLHGVVIKMKI
jgi:hypothetical protein